METIDDEITDAAEAFIRKAVDDGKPFFVWWNTTRMHIWTHLEPEAQGVTGLGIYPDGMVEHDGHVGRMLDLLDELGVTDNTIVMYSTDNGAEEMTWPDGGTTPFRGEKDTTFDGGFRVPCLWRWPGVIEPGTISNDIGSHEDCLPTFLAAAGQPDITQQLLDGLEVGDRTYKVHIDGYNFMPYWAGEDDAPPRQEFFYWTDDGDLAALRYNNWKIHFIEQRAEGLDVWQEPFVQLAVPEADEPALRPVRGRRHPLRALSRMADPACLRAGAGPGVCGAVPGDLPGVPAAADAGQLLRRRRAGKPDRRQRRAGPGRAARTGNVAAPARAPAGTSGSERSRKCRRFGDERTLRRVSWDWIYDQPFAVRAQSCLIITRAGSTPGSCWNAP